MVNASPTAPGSDDKLYGGLSYAGLVVCCVPLVPLIVFFIKKDESRFIKFHALQATAFGLAAIVVSILLGILSAVIGMAVPLLGTLISIPVQLFLLVYWVYLTVQVFRGTDMVIPGLGQFINDNLMN